MKRDDIQIYVLSHKPIDYQREDALYTPLQVGKNADFCDLRDNTGDNISEWNPVYAETTGTYWIWKNRPQGLKYVGETQYRRRLEFPEDTDFDAIFKDYEVITMEPIRLGLAPQPFYGRCHSKDDIDAAERVVKDLHPEMSVEWDKIMKLSPYLLYSNGFILPADEFDRYCEFLFPVLEEVISSKGWTSPETALEKCGQEISLGKRPRARGVGYQAQIGGFLSERLWTFWCYSQYGRRLHKNYRKFEGV